MPGYASHILEGYLRDIKMDRPADAAQQYQIALLQQWMDHLQVVLRENDVPNEVAGRIMREVVYGSMPQAAEAKMRTIMSEAHTADLERMTAGVPLPSAGPEPRSRTEAPEVQQYWGEAEARRMAPRASPDLGLGRSDAPRPAGRRTVTGTPDL